MQAALFISYATEDNAYVATLATLIEAELGWPAWYFERDEPAGVYYRDEIIKQIDASRAVLVVLSPFSAFSRSVEREVDQASRCGKPIIVLVIGSVRHDRIDAGMTRSPLLFELGVTNMIDARAGRNPIPQLRRDLAAPAASPTVQLGDALETLGPGVASNGAHDLSGRTIQGYTVDRLVATTLGSVVYQATERSVERTVALKAIRPEHTANAAFQQRFRDEARRIAALEHPHIVPLYNFWSDPHGAFLAMRWLPNGTLNTLIGGGPNPPGLVARLMRQVGDALIYAHRQGVTHRDIKPANILRDQQGNACLSDFSIAHGLHAGHGHPDAGYTPGYAPPEQVAGAAPTPQADIYSLAVVAAELLLGARLFAGENWLAQQRTGLPAPLLAQLLAPVRPALQRALDPVPGARHPDMLSFVAELQRALHAARGVPSPADGEAADEALVDAPNPYLGLRAFTERDAVSFFGRAAAISEVLRRLAEPHAQARFLAVAGASGSGKSSLVQAGLIPALRAGRLPGAERWRMRVLTPGAQPLESLAAALGAELGAPPQTLRDTLAHDERGLLRAIAASSTSGTELLLVIDQFEELFTLVEDQRQRQHVLALLLAAVREPTGRLRVLVTLRGDFYDRPLQDLEFGKLLLSRTVWVEPLSEGELEDAIVQPARQVGVGVQRALVREVLADVAGQPGILPLLQHALADLFERREGGSLTLELYEARDGVLGSLGRRAEELFAELSAEQQLLAEQLFLRLVTPGEGAEDTRRRVRRDELADLAPSTLRTISSSTTLPNPAPGSSPSPPVEPHTRPSPSDLALVLERYGAARLLTFDREPVTQAATVEVAHEALLHRERGWWRLRRWLDVARDDLRTQRRLGEAATEWQRQGRDDFLTTGGALAQFEELRERDLVALTGLERAYLAASIAAREQGLAEKETARQRELEQARRLAEEQAARARLAALQAEKERELVGLANQRAEEQALANQRLRRRAVYLTAALTLAVSTTLVAIWFGMYAQQQGKLAVGRELVAQANNLVDSQPLLALHMAAEGVQLIPPSYTLTYSELLSNAVKLAQMGRVQVLAKNAINSTGSGASLYLSPDGSRAFIIKRDGPDELHNLLTQQVISHFDNVTRVEFSPDNRWLIVSYELKPGVLYDIENDRRVALPDRHDEAYFSPDSRWLAVTKLEANAIGDLWDLQNLGRTVLPYNMNWAAFSPDSSWVVFAYFDAPGELRNLKTGAKLALADEIQFGLMSRVVLFAPNSSSVTIHYARLAPEVRALRTESVRSFTGVQRVSSNGEWGIAAYKGRNGKLVHITDNIVIPLSGEVFEADFSPDNQWLLIDYRGPGELWHLPSRKYVTLNHWILSVDFSNNSQWVFITYHDGRPGELHDLRGEVSKLIVSDIEDMEFSPNGATAWILYKDGTSELRESANMLQPLVSLGFGATKSMISRDGTYAIARYSVGLVYMIDISLGRSLNGDGTAASLSRVICSSALAAERWTIADQGALEKALAGYKPQACESVMTRPPNN